MGIFNRTALGLNGTRTAVVTGLPQLFAFISFGRHTQFLYQISPKLPAASTFSVPPGAQRRYNVLLGNDLEFP
jgi:hypothetical protein